MNKYKNITVIYSIALITSVVVTLISLYEILFVNPIMTDQFKYWMSFKVCAIIFAVVTGILILLMIIAKICNAKKIRVEKALITCFILLIVSAVSLTAYYAVNAYRNSFSNNLNSISDVLPNDLQEINYLDYDKIQSFDVKSCGNSNTSINAVYVKADKNELSYYRCDSYEKIMEYIFDIHLILSKDLQSYRYDSIAGEEINPSDRDYYIYETNNSFIFREVSTDENFVETSCYCEALKRDNYSIKQFEKDVLNLNKVYAKNQELYQNNKKTAEKRMQSWQKEMSKNKVFYPKGV